MCPKASIVLDRRARRNPGHSQPPGPASFRTFPSKIQFKRYVPFARTTSNDLRYTAPSLASTTDMTTTPTKEFSSLKHPIPSVMVRLGILSRRGIPERLLAFNPKRPSSVNRPLYSACTPLYGSIIATNLVISSDRGPGLSPFSISPITACLALYITTTSTPHLDIFTPSRPLLSLVNRYLGTFIPLHRLYGSAVQKGGCPVSYLGYSRTIPLATIP